MKIKEYLIFSSLPLVLTGCCMLSSINYTKGTECIQNGDYQDGITYLKRAVELDPGMSRNHNNLAGAYIEVGEWDKAWYHSRQAVLCLQDNPEARDTFYLLYNKYVTERGLDREGISQQEVFEKLGMPDMTMMFGNEMIAMYGLCQMKFANNKLVSCTIY